MRTIGLLVVFLSLLALVVAQAASYPSGYGRRALSETSRQLLCPQGLSACQIYGHGAEFWECVDIKQDLESCGGCMIQSSQPGFSKDIGVDCTAISGVSDVSCVQGKCLVHRCLPGYQVDLAGNSCEDSGIPPPTLVLQSGRRSLSK